MTSPVLVIHGTEDEVIDFSHGLAIYEKCPRAVEPLWVEVSTTQTTVRLLLDGTDPITRRSLSLRHTLFSNVSLSPMTS